MSNSAVWSDEWPDELGWYFHRYSFAENCRYEIVQVQVVAEGAVYGLRPGVANMVQIATRQDRGWHEFAGPIAYPPSSPVTAEATKP
jgi:hypothetical protein